MSHTSPKLPNYALRRAREQRGWSQEQVAAQIGSSAFTVHRWEQGLTTPSPHFRQKLCMFFELSLQELGILAEVQENVSEREIATCWNMPCHRNPFFTGRDDLLTQIATLFKDNETTQSRSIVALSGLGGIGKTQLAIEYAYQHKRMYQAVLWVTADSSALLHEQFGHLAQVLHLPQEEKQEPYHMIKAVQDWLQEQSSWLLIFDNVEDIQSLYDLIPTAYQGHILLTTRLHAVGIMAPRLEVVAMTPTEGMAFLLRRAKMISPGTSTDTARLHDQRTARKLVNLMGGLPLALDQAGAYIEEMACDLAGYLQRYQAHQAQMLMRRGTSFEHPDSVMTTWSITFEKLQQTHEKAIQLLQFCAFLHPDTIPEEIFLVDTTLGFQPFASDLLSLDALINAACTFSLVRRRSKTNTLSMHRLVQRVLKERMDAQTQQNIAKQVIYAVSALFPDCTFATWSLCHRYLASALICADLSAHWQLILPEAARLLYQTGVYVQTQAQYVQAENLFMQARDIYKQLYGGEHLDVANCQFALASLYEVQWKEDQGEELYRSALEMRTHLLGAAHSLVAHSFNALATLSYKQGKYAQARELYHHALNIFEQAGENNSLDIASCLNNLAPLYREQGDYIQAKQFQQRALTMREQILGPDHPDIATSLRNLAAIHLECGQYHQAEPLYQRALEIREKALGSEHPDVSMILRSLGMLYHFMGKYTEAEQFYQRTFAIRHKAFGPQHPFVADAFLVMAELHTAQRKYAEAQTCFQQALTIWETTGGPDHPDCVHCHSGLAALFVAQERYNEAAPLCQQALISWERTFGMHHPYVAQCLEIQAAILAAQASDTEAEMMYQRALTINAQSLGGTHPSVATTLSKLATFYLKRQRFLQAEQFYRRALAIYEKTLDQGHPLVADCKKQLAIASLSLNQ